ncbi:TnsD family transposase [Lysinibacillus endophyticus]|uniref:TnsD family transposase n=1 Tax=Ureibacillus endophyticus TaxID=1978490 RepID=UPI0031363E44
MLIFFPTPYPDELLYSVCARYHVRSGNVSYKRTLDDIFENRGLTASVFLPSGIGSLVKSINNAGTFNEQKVIYKHTMFLFFTAFLSEEKSQQIFQSMCSDDGKSIYVRAGINASGVPQNKYLRFCPKCMKEDKEKYGEHYWHRSHQIPGIHCCLKHLSLLYNSAVRTVPDNKHRFHIPTSNNCIVAKESYVFNGVKKKTITAYLDIVKKLAPYIELLMNELFPKHDLQWFDQKYRSKLVEMNMAYYTGRVKQKIWREYFSSFYDKEVLQLFSSSLSNEGDWLSMIVQKNRKSFHPIRHLLVMSALGLSLEDVFSREIEEPFGKPNWYCLNTVCNYHHQPVIEEVTVTLCEKTKAPIGTFTCPRCRFSYTRRGPDKNEKDRYCKTRVKQYGHVWNEKLQEFAGMGLSLRELSRKMGADPNTIKRYLTSVGNDRVILNENRGKYIDRKAWLKLQEKHPDKSKTELRKINNPLYMKLYRKDKQWLEENSPRTVKRFSAKNVGWEERDEELLLKAIKIVEEILNSEEKPIRITISRIGSLMGEKALLEKKLNKLPKLKAYLYEKIETIEQFQKRRIKYVIHQMNIRREELDLWKVIRKSGIKNSDKKACEMAQQILKNEIQGINFN